MPEDLLTTAISNWGPRFTANGVDASDYTAITAPLTSWDEWCGAWSRGAETYLELATRALEQSHFRTAGEHLSRAATYFHFGKFLFVHDREQARAASDRAVDALTRALPYLDPPGERIEIPFLGYHLVGILRTPLGVGPFPVAWMIPGLDSTKEELREVERSFLARGVATFACDGPGQGEVEWHLPIEPDWSGVGEAVLGHLRTDDRIDNDRIGIWGVSLGAYYAARVAAAGLGVRATVALSGPYDFGASFENLNPLTRRAFQVRCGATTIEQAAVRARDLTLDGLAKNISDPLLVIMGARDRLFPPSDGERLVAEAAGPSEFWMLPTGNHGCANVINHHRPQSADWLAHHLGVAK
jgi:2,6-dihydroxypseudooxynicotine hydrolase